MRRDLASERGQTIAVTAVFLTVLIATAAFVLDIGSWFRADRQAQTMADAAALAGAQALPADPATAQALAAQYVDENDGTDATETVTISSAVLANDTITVEVEQAAPGFFAKIFGIDAVDVHAKATARTGALSQAKFVAPMVVKETHPGLQCPKNGQPVGPCTGTTYSLPYDKDLTDAPGAFGMLNLASDGGTVGSSTLADWILHGYNGYLGKGDYNSDPGAKFSAGVVRDALETRKLEGTPLLFPVYKKLTGQGSGAKYTIIGWVGFVITSYTIQGNNATLTGYFTETYVEGIQTTSTSDPDFGAHDIDLID